MQVQAEIAVWLDGSSLVYQNFHQKQHVSLYSLSLLHSSLQEKLQNKLKKEADEKKFKFAKVDGRTEQVEPL